MKKKFNFKTRGMLGVLCASMIAVNSSIGSINVNAEEFSEIIQGISSDEETQETAKTDEGEVAQTDENSNNDATGQENVDDKSNNESLTKEDSQVSEESPSDETQQTVDELQPDDTQQNIEELQPDQNSENVENSQYESTSENENDDLIPNDDLDNDENESNPDLFTKNLGDPSSTNFETPEEYEEYMLKKFRNHKYFSESNTPWLVNYEYHIEGDTLFLDKNISFEFGDGFLIIPSGAVVNGNTYKVEINASSDFFCEDAKNNALAVWLGSSYFSALYELSQYEVYELGSDRYRDINEKANAIIYDSELEGFVHPMQFGSKWGDAHAKEYRYYLNSQDVDIKIHNDATRLFSDFRTGVFHLQTCDFSDVKSVLQMFANSGLEYLDDFSFPPRCKNDNYEGMFDGCNSLRFIDNITIMDDTSYCNLFANCSELEKVHNISYSGGPVNASGMFMNCDKLERVYFSLFHRFGVNFNKDYIVVHNMFDGCDNLSDVSFNDINLVDIEGLFAGCPNLRDVYFRTCTWIVDRLPQSNETNYGKTNARYYKEDAQNYELFDERAEIRNFYNFKDIIIDCEDCPNPYIFLNGNLFHMYGGDDNASKYYRGIDLSTPKDAELISTYLANRIDFYVNEDSDPFSFYYENEIDILPNHVSVDGNLYGSNGQYISGWFTKKRFGRKLNIGDNPEDFYEAYAVFQNPYEIQYNDEMPNFFNGAFNRNTYYVSDSKWKELKSKLNKTEYNRIYNKYKSWKAKSFKSSGICYGISVAQVAAHAGKLAYNKKIHDLDPSYETDRELLTLYHLGQVTNAFRNARNQFNKKDKKSKLIELVYRALSEDGPAVLVYYIPGDNAGEHAVVIDSCEVINETINGQKYKWKIKTYNINSNEGMELSDNDAAMRADISDFDIYVSEDYKYITNKSIEEYNSTKQDASRILAIYDNIDAINYFGTLKAKENKDGYSIISVYKGTINKIGEFMTEIFSIFGEETSSSEEYFVDYNNEAYDSNEPIKIIPGEEGIEFTYETKNKLVTFKSDSKEPVKVFYDAHTDDYRIESVSGKYIEVETVNDDGASFGTILKGNVKEEGHSLEVSSSNDKVLVNSDAEISAELFVADKDSKVADINAKGVTISDSYDDSKVEIKLDSDNNGEFKDRTIDINYANDYVSSVNDSAHPNESNEGDGNNNPQQDGSDVGNSQNDQSPAGNVQTEPNVQENSADPVNNTNNQVNSESIIQIGTEFTSAGKVYEVTGDNTLVIKKLENKDAKTLSIPSSVVYENRVYSVTAIASGAFKGLKKLKTVTIPSSVTAIGKKAFYNCSKLKKVTIKANSSLAVGKSAFKKVNKGCSINVKGLKKKAKASFVKSLKKQTNANVK